MDTTKTFMEANIPIEKLDHPSMRCWMDKYVKVVYLCEYLVDLVEYFSTLEEVTAALKYFQDMSHDKLASMISRSLKAEIPNPYASNWLERLRQIKRLRLKVLQENMSATSDNSSSEKDVSSPPRRVHMDDFTEYT
uniref:Uncharacterized protein n=1 Tax=Timema tahoe TaxID=61484 RepID=A0A7R9IL80_9NEOP|nr:unnamed protein product [Timema tahoe]